jgi:hypothetical protein
MKRGTIIRRIRKYFKPVRLLLVSRGRNGIYVSLFAAGLLVCCCAACNHEQASQPSPQTPFDLWQSFKLHEYTVDQIRSCFCPHAGEEVRIMVRSDTIYRMTLISDGSVVSYPYYVTVDSLFSIIQNSKTDSLVVRYNAQYGYPEFVDVNPQLHPMDGGYLLETSNLQIP